MKNVSVLMELLFSAQFQASTKSWTKQNDLGTFSGLSSNKMNVLRITLHIHPRGQASRSPGDGQLMGSISAAVMAPVYVRLLYHSGSSLEYLFLLRQPIYWGINLQVNIPHQ